MTTPKDPIARARQILREWEQRPATDAEVFELRTMLGPILDDAAAWRKGADVLRELQTRVIPCGHKIEDLISGGPGSITKCGACLSEHRRSIVVALGKQIVELGRAEEMAVQEMCTIVSNVAKALDPELCDPMGNEPVWIPVQRMRDRLAKLETAARAAKDLLDEDGTNRTCACRVCVVLTEALEKETA
jgi:hypothetical protein